MLKIAVAQMKVIPGHPDENTANMLSMVEEAKKHQADIIIFPEMAVPGYLLGDTWEQTAFIRDCEECGQDIIAASQDIAIIFGNVAADWNKKNNDGRVRKYNALFLAHQGQLVQPENMPYPFVIKALMPNYREFNDTRHFFSLRQLAEELHTTAEKLLSPLKLTLKGRSYSIGAFLCEDGWSDDYNLAPVEILRSKGVDMLVDISSSPYTLGKNGKRHRVFGRLAKEAGVPLFYVNNVGIQNNGKTVYTFDGDISITLAGKAGIGSAIYGASRYAQVTHTGNVNITVSDNVYCSQPVYAAGNCAIFNGNTKIVLNGGELERNIFGGSNTGTMNGDAEIVINGGRFVYNGSATSASNVPDYGTSNIYGGGTSKSTLNGNASVIMNGGEIFGDLCGTSGPVSGTKTITVKGGTVYGMLRDADITVDLSGGKTLDLY
ncbi:MAG: hypothetical protein IIX05_02065, partial [Selenomonadaceae bacterium]|nr:hypothetical protein [Selenomonadaceae bacterium]